MNLKQKYINIFRLAYYLSLGFFIYLMILITFQYIPIDFNAAFLNIKYDEIQLKHYQLAFFSHVYSSIFVLITGSFQFSSYLRIRTPYVHRVLGKIYIGAILFLASPYGLIMGYYANGGLFSKISFCFQAILWFIFTYYAYIYAKRKDWKKHQSFMIRSFALTLSAISLRIFKWFIANTYALPPMDTYRIVAWLGWTVNILIAEFYIFNIKKNALK